VSSQSPPMNSPFTVLSVFLLALFDVAHAAESTKAPVSYYKEVRPVLQAKCMGCHQPAKAKGDYVMTTFAQLIKGGENGSAIVAHRPGESLLVQQVTPVDGKVEMPPKGEPMSTDEVALLGRWITEGALDDTPANAVERYSPEHPPVYAKPPVITAIDYSPDGKLLAVAGFHEVLLHQADGSGLVARLVGLSERIQSIEFSPDGSRLAVAGGLPERMGELQIWDIASRSLKVSVPAGYDTIYGASWSPDGKLVSFGMPDNTVRAVKAENGEQVLFMGGHNDWVLDTVFSHKGDQVISVARDMSAKLTEVATERFIDNITSITPGALRGGIATVVLHPLADHILVGGSDGIPQIYRTKRETARKIGDNANLIRKYPAMEGRIWAAAFRPDGKSFVAGSSLNGRGSVHFYSSDYDATIPPEVKTAMEKADVRPGSADYKLIEEFQTRGATQTAALPLDSAVYALAWSPDSSTVVAAGADGKLRFIDPSTAKITRDLVPVAATASLADEHRSNADKHPEVPKEAPVNPSGVASLEITPAQVRIDGPVRYNQVVVTALMKDGGKFDVTRMAKLQPAQPLVEVTARGKVLPVRDGTTTLAVEFGSAHLQVPVTVSGTNSAFHPDWTRDVNPVISRMGCNMGTCHGAQDGKDGFKLSLRGYDPFYDVRAFTDDLTSRRVRLRLARRFPDAPQDDRRSPSRRRPAHPAGIHLLPDGSRLDFPGSPAQCGLHQSRLDRDLPAQPSHSGHRRPSADPGRGGLRRRFPARYHLRSLCGKRQQRRGHPRPACADYHRPPGEAPILARYEGAYAATTLTVMGNREGFVWLEPAAHNPIDEFTSAKWKRLKIQPSELCSDTEFIRRVTIDLTGLPPSASAVRAFEADLSPQREKRDHLIDSLIGSPDFVDYWTNKWSDMLQVNSKFLGRKEPRHSEIGSGPRSRRTRHTINSFTTSSPPPAPTRRIRPPPIIRFSGLRRISWRTPLTCSWRLASIATSATTTRSSAGLRISTYQTAAYFAQVNLKRDAKNAPNQSIGASAVDEPKPLYEIISDAPAGEVTHVRTGQVKAPAFPFQADLAPVSFRVPEKPARRESLAAWMTSADNPYFALSYTNRIWGYLLGTGIIEPLDDIRAATRRPTRNFSLG